MTLSKVLFAGLILSGSSAFAFDLIGREGPSFFSRGHSRVVLNSTQPDDLAACSNGTSSEAVAAVSEAEVQGRKVCEEMKFKNIVPFTPYYWTAVVKGGDGSFYCEAWYQFRCFN